MGPFQYAPLQGSGPGNIPGLPLFSSLIPPFGEASAPSTPLPTHFRQQQSMASQQSIVSQQVMFPQLRPVLPKGVTYAGEKRKASSKVVEGCQRRRKRKVLSDEEKLERKKAHNRRQYEKNKAVANQTLTEDDLEDLNDFSCAPGETNILSGNVATVVDEAGLQPPFFYPSDARKEC